MVRHVSREGEVTGSNPIGRVARKIYAKNGMTRKLMIDEGGVWRKSVAGGLNGEKGYWARRVTT